VFAFTTYLIIIYYNNSTASFLGHTIYILSEVIDLKNRIPQKYMKVDLQLHSAAYDPLIEEQRCFSQSRSTTTRILVFSNLVHLWTSFEFTD